MNSSVGHMDRMMSLIHEVQQSDHPHESVEFLISTAIKNALLPQQSKRPSDILTTSSNHHLAPTSSPSHGSHGPSLTSTELISYPETQRIIQQSMQDNPGAQGLTPLTLLDQLLTKLNLECRFIEQADSSTGPFRFQCEIFRLSGKIPIVSGGTVICKTKKAAKQAAASSLLELVLPVMRRGGASASKSEMVHLLESVSLTSVADGSEASSHLLQRPSSASKETQQPHLLSKRGSRSLHHTKPLPPHQRPLKPSSHQHKTNLPQTSAPTFEDGVMGGRTAVGTTRTSSPIVNSSAIGQVAGTSVEQVDGSSSNLMESLMGSRTLAKRPFSMMGTQDDSNSLNPSRRPLNISLSSMGLSGGESGNEGEENLQKRKNHVSSQKEGATMDVGNMLDDVRRLLQGAGIKPL